MRPAAHCRTSIEGYSFKIYPENHFINWHQDPFGNYQARVVYNEKTTELRVEVEVIAKLEVINPYDFFIEEYAENFPFLYANKLHKELWPYLEVSQKERGFHFDAFVEKLAHKKDVITVDFLVFANQLVFQTLNYNIRLEVGVQTCEDTLELQSGSCRDFAWLLVQALRSIGFH